MTKKIGITPGLVAFAAMLLGSATAVFGQDITLYQTTTSTGMMGSGSVNVNSTQYYSGKALRISSSDGHDSIIRFDTGKIITIDNKQKTYTEMTVEQLNDFFEKQTAQMGMDKEKLDQMRKMMGQMADSFSVTKEGPGESIAGYATEKYIVKGPMEMEIYAAPDLKIPALYYDVMKMRVPRNPLFDTGKMYDEMKKIEGMPLKTITTMKMMNMEMKTTTVVTKVEKAPIPASIFDVPAGYKQVQMKL
jgi:hypothetical protein